MIYFTKRQNINEWHTWFAWYPIVVDRFEVKGQFKTVWTWLEYVQIRWLPKRGSATGPNQRKRFSVREARPVVRSVA